MNQRSASLALCPSLIVGFTSFRRKAFPYHDVIICCFYVHVGVCIIHSRHRSRQPSRITHIVIQSETLKIWYNTPPVCRCSHLIISKQRYRIATQVCIYKTVYHIKWNIFLDHPSFLCSRIELRWLTRPMWAYDTRDLNNLNKMSEIWQTAFSSAFSWQKNVFLHHNFTGLFIGVQLTTKSALANGCMPRHYLNNDEPVQWCVYESPCLSELTHLIITSDITRTDPGSAPRPTGGSNTFHLKVPKFKVLPYCAKRHEHDDVIKWKHFLRYWPYVRGIRRWILLTKASDADLRYLLWPAPWINGWVNNRGAVDLRRHRAHYDVIVLNRVLLCRTRTLRTI